MTDLIRKRGGVAGLVSLVVVGAIATADAALGQGDATSATEATSETSTEASPETCPDGVTPIPSEGVETVEDCPPVDDASGDSGSGDSGSGDSGSGEEEPAPDPTPAPTPTDPPVGSDPEPPSSGGGGSDDGGSDDGSQGPAPAPRAGDGRRDYSDRTVGYRRIALIEPSKRDRARGRASGHGGEVIAGRIGALGPLPDPIPAARRLDPGFARDLSELARHHDVDWALILAILRVRGERGQVPASNQEIREIARWLARTNGSPERLARFSRRLFDNQVRARRVVALTRYHHAVGLRGIVQGLDQVKSRLERRALRNDHLEIYPGGRADIAAGRIDVRVLTLMLYLAKKYDGVSVSSLETGHSYFTSSGNPSMHAFGRAVDVSALRGVPILGHQWPGGITERALRNILLLPKSLQPRQLISLFDLGGPSFAMTDHHDHIHVGY